MNILSLKIWHRTHSYRVGLPQAMLLIRGVDGGMDRSLGSFDYKVITLLTELTGHREPY